MNARHVVLDVSVGLLSGTMRVLSAVYVRSERRASVRAVTDGRVLVLDQQALTRMHTERPALAYKFNRVIIVVLAGRLERSNNEVVELSTPITQ